MFCLIVSVSKTIRVGHNRIGGISNIRYCADGGACNDKYVFFTIQTVAQPHFVAPHSTTVTAKKQKNLKKSKLST